MRHFKIKDDPALKKCCLDLCQSVLLVCSLQSIILILMEKKLFHSKIAALSPYPVLAAALRRPNQTLHRAIHLLHRCAEPGDLPALEALDLVVVAEVHLPQAGHLIIHPRIS